MMRKKELSTACSRSYLKRSLVNLGTDLFPEKSLWRQIWIVYCGGIKVNRVSMSKMVIWKSLVYSYDGTVHENSEELLTVNLPVVNDKRICTRNLDIL